MSAQSSSVESAPATKLVVSSCLYLFYLTCSLLQSITSSKSSSSSSSLSYPLASSFTFSAVFSFYPSQSFLFCFVCGDEIPMASLMADWLSWSNLCHWMQESSLVVGCQKQACSLFSQCSVCSASDGNAMTEANPCFAFFVAWYYHIWQHQRLRPIEVRRDYWMNRSLSTVLNAESMGHSVQRGLPTLHEVEMKSHLPSKPWEKRT